MSNTKRATQTPASTIVQVTLPDGSVVNQPSVGCSVVHGVLSIDDGNGAVVHLAPGCWVRAIDTGKSVEALSLMAQVPLAPNGDTDDTVQEPDLVIPC